MRVKEPNDTESQKLFRIITYLKGENRNYLTLSANDLKVIKWYVDASFAVHPDFKGNTGDIMIME